jgi:excisionase family DNA binding protein
MKASGSKRSSSATDASQAAAAALLGLANLRGKKGHNARLRAAGPSGEVEVVLPPGAFEIVLDALALLSSGHGARVIPVEAELTTQEAAELLNVSRPFLVALLDDGRIPHRRVGSHRRVRSADVLAYKSKDEARRRRVLDELTSEAEKHGLGY